MSTNRSSTFPLNREIIKDKDVTQKGFWSWNQLDEFINSPGTDPGSVPLVRGPINVSNNILASLFKAFRIMPGMAAVVVSNGQVLEVITEGSYHALSFPVLSRLDLFAVNMRERVLSMETTQEFTLFYQIPNKDMPEIPVTVDLDVSVTYQVVDPGRVALYVEQPMTTLFDTVLESMRAIVAYAKYRDFQAGGQAGYMILQQLQQRGIDQSLGIQVFNVQITRLKGDDKVDEIIRNTYFVPQQAHIEATATIIKEQARMQLEMQQARQNMQLQLEQASTDRDAAQLVDMTREYVAKFLPDQYEQIFGNRAITDQLRLQMLGEIAKSGMMGSLLAGEDFQDVLRIALGAPPLGPRPTPGSPNAGTPALAGDEYGSRFSATTGMSRLQEEVNALTNQGMNATLRQDMGTFYVVVNLRDSTGHTMDIFFACTEHYPHQAPVMFLEIDGQQQPYRPSALTNWSPLNSLVDLVQAVVQAYS